MATDSIDRKFVIKDHKTASVFTEHFSKPNNVVYINKKTDLNLEMKKGAEQLTRFFSR